MSEIDRNFVKRSFFEKTQGFKWLKMEVVDDISFGLLIKKNNGLSDFLSGIDKS